MLYFLHRLAEGWHNHNEDNDMKAQDVVQRDKDNYDQDLEQLDIDGVTITYDDIESYTIKTANGVMADLDYNGVIAVLRCTRNK